LCVSVSDGKALPVTTPPNRAGLHASNAFRMFRSDRFALPAPAPPPAPPTAAGLLAPQLHAWTRNASAPTGGVQCRPPSVRVIVETGLPFPLPEFPWAATPTDNTSTDPAKQTNFMHTSNRVLPPTIDCGCEESNPTSIGGLPVECVVPSGLDVPVAQDRGFVGRAHRLLEGRAGVFLDAGLALGPRRVARQLAVDDAEIRVRRLRS